MKVRLSVCDKHELLVWSKTAVNGAKALIALSLVCTVLLG